MTLSFPRPVRGAALLAALAALPALFAPPAASASSHREAPLVREDPVADDTDFYMFRDLYDPNRVVLIGDWIPLEEPGGGPNFANFGEHVRYQFEIDNDGDGQEDITYRFEFTRHVRNAGTFLYNVGPVTSLASENLNVYYSYSVDKLLGPEDSPTGRSRIADGLVEAPPNIGPASFPEGYEKVSAQAAYYLSSGEVVFAGPRADPFYVDLGSVFDLLNVPGRAVYPFNGFGQNGVAGYDVHAIALSIPIDQLTRNRSIPTDTADPNAVLSGWAATYRQTTRTLNADGSQSFSGPWRQVSRLGNPLVNEAVIPVGMKDKFNATEPKDDLANFGTYVLNSELAGLLHGVLGVDVPPNPRTDLLVLVQGIDGLTRRPGEVVSDQLRLNVAVPPTPVASVNRLGVLANDPAGFPNGRRPYDDVVDIELRVIAGVLVDGFNKAPNNALSDLVDGPDQAFLPGFPYLATPHNGFDHKHDGVNDPRICNVGSGAAAAAQYAPDGTRLR
ncbi:MAG: DUF4331 domain-containing protein [Acidobacteriota bacterium]